MVARSFPPIARILMRGNVLSCMKPMYHLWEPIHSPTRRGQTSAEPNHLRPVLLHGLEGRTVFETSNEDRMFGTLNDRRPKFGDYARIWTNVRRKCWDGLEGEGL